MLVAFTYVYICRDGLNQIKKGCMLYFSIIITFKTTSWTYHTIAYY